MIAAAMAPQNQIICKKFIRFYIFAAPGPSEGWRGQDQGRLRSASGGHAERLPHVGRIGNHVSQAFFFAFISEPSTAESHSTSTYHPKTYVLSPVLPFFCEWVCERACFDVEGKEKDVLYSLLFVASYRRTLDPLHDHWSCMHVCGLGVCMRERAFKPVSSLCLHNFHV